MPSPAKHTAKVLRQSAPGNTPDNGPRELIDAVPAILWRANPDTFHFTFVSRHAEALLGYPLRRWTEEPAFWKDHIYPADKEFVVTQRVKAIRETGAYDLEYRMVAADGRLLWVRDLGWIVAGELVGFIADLSQKRFGSAALGETKLWLRQVIDAIPQEIWSGPADGSIDFCNARWRSELGLTLEDIEGDGWQRMLHPDDRERIVNAWHDSVANGTPYEQLERHRLADGQYRWFLCRGVPLRDEQGRVVRWFGTNTDVENQKQAENNLRRSEQRWRAVFDNARVGVALMDASMHFVAVNAAWKKMIGHSTAELRSMTCMELIHEDDRAAYRVLYDELLTGKRDRFEFEGRYRRKDGSILWAHLNGSALLAPAGEEPLWVVMAEDITERKRLGNELERQNDRLRLLLDLTHQFVAKMDVPSVIDAVLAALRQRDGWTWAAILLPGRSPESSMDRLTVYLNRGSDTSLLAEDTTVPIEGSISGKVYQSGQPVTFRAEDLPGLSLEFRNSTWMQDVSRREGLTGGYILPLVHAGSVLGVLFLATRGVREFEQLDYLQELTQFIAAALNHALRYDELTSSHERLANEKKCIAEQIRSVFDFENIIGRSRALREVLEQVRTVAPTDSAVLLLGETGTGKELIARAIHNRSSRRDQAFIKVDCSAIPATLLESELFGYERGAFTGAIQQKLGRLEIAERGTLFLDEVGDIPLELQTKLLRVLQDQSFERLGSNRTRHLGVRIIGATNRDLEDMVAKGQFRADLYYRLKVFPITIPPLRDRREDIPPLVRHYVRKYAQRMKKQIDTIPAAAMDLFTRYPWPGNVRELQHFIERSVVLTSGHVLQAPLRELEQAIRERRATGTSRAAGRTMAEIERDAILHALRESNWVVGGPHGAAAKLGLKRTTLATRMERLGIARRR